VLKRLAAVAIALCVATAALALDVPPKPTAWVTDRAGILSAEQQQALNEKLEAFAKDPQGAQFLVFTFPSLEGEDVDGYANRVADVWKIKGDRALLLLIFVKEHKIAIRTGYSMEEYVTDAVSSRVIRETMAPYFRQGQYYEGIDAAINELGKRINPNFSPASRSLPTSATQRGSGSAQIAPRDIMFLIFIVLIFIFVVGPMMRRGGCGGCSGCIWPMFWGGGGGGTFGGGGFSGGGSGGGGWSVGGGWGGGGSSFGGGGASGGG
jgi:uncharacterized protein